MLCSNIFASKETISELLPCRKIEVKECTGWLDGYVHYKAEQSRLMIRSWVLRMDKAEKIMFSRSEIIADM